MAEHNDTGKKGEEIAVNFLKNKGYRILDRNWRLGSNEIDIIAADGNFIVVAEVKTRTSNKFGEPEIAVTKEKQKALIRAANAYVKIKQIDQEMRFDIVSIILVKDKEQVHHIVDAFYPMIK